MFPSLISVLLFLSIISVVEPEPITAQVDFFFLLDVSEDVTDSELELMGQFVKSWPDHFKVSESDSKMAVFPFGGLKVHEKQKLTADEPRVRKLNLTGSYARTGKSPHTHNALDKVDELKGSRDALKIIILVTKSAPSHGPSAVKKANELTKKGLVIYAIVVGGSQPIIEEAVGKENVVYKSSYDDLNDTAAVNEFVQKVACTFDEVCKIPMVSDQCKGVYERTMAPVDNKCTNKPSNLFLKDCCATTKPEPDPAKGEGDGTKKEGKGNAMYIVGAVVAVVLIAAIIIIIVVGVILYRKKKQREALMGDATTIMASKIQKSQAKSVKSQKKDEVGKSKIDAKKSTVDMKKSTITPKEKSAIGGKSEVKGKSAIGKKK